ncbi:hypothetical protein IV203_019111 [Nitzschia inconspicua]|uniref:Uncharacterized protein n=1 Tax=Nitzschia inconspicua TaxID=303405 RepID=A0A9K3Q4M2_9STRA|nr:hypothetical protein IV203_019111 [Nitzschia inconspicua]
MSLNAYNRALFMLNRSATTAGSSNAPTSPIHPNELELDSQLQTAALVILDREKPENTMKAMVTVSVLRYFIMSNDSYKDKMKAVLSKLKLPMNKLLHLGRNVGTKILEFLQAESEDIRKLGNWNPSIMTAVIQQSFQRKRFANLLVSRMDNLFMLTPGLLLTHHKSSFDLLKQWQIL